MRKPMPKTRKGCFALVLNIAQGSNRSKKEQKRHILGYIPDSHRAFAIADRLNLWLHDYDRQLSWFCRDYGKTPHPDDDFVAAASGELNRLLHTDKKEARFCLTKYGAWFELVELDKIMDVAFWGASDSA